MPRNPGLGDRIPLGFYDDSNSAHDGRKGHCLQEAEPDDRRPHQATHTKVRVARQDPLIKPVHELVELTAYTAHQPIAKAWQLAQGYSRTGLYRPGRLPQRQEDNRPVSPGR